MILSTATIIDSHLELVKGKYENSELESFQVKDNSEV